MTEVAKLVFQPRQIMVYLSDGTVYPLRIHPAVQRHVERLVAEFEHLRPVGREMAELTVHADRAGVSTSRLLSGMVAEIERLGEQLEQERASGAAQIAAKNRAVTMAARSGRCNALRSAAKLVGEQRDHLQRHGSPEVAAVVADVLGTLVRRLAGDAERMEVA